MTKPLIVFPFDHRGSLGRDILKISYPAKTTEEVALFKGVKTLLFAAFKEAARKNPGTSMSILVDSEFGADIHQLAEAEQIPHYLTLEASGRPLRLEDPQTLTQRLASLKPTGTKILVHYVLGQEGVNAQARQTLFRAQELSSKNQLPLMLEVLADGPHPTKDENVLAVIQELVSHHLQPQVWKLEGLDNSATWQRIKQVTPADIIVLGRGESIERVREWLTIAKASGVVNGFAVGRTLWAKEIRAWHQGHLSYSQAVELIASNLTTFVNLWMS